MEKILNELQLEGGFEPPYISKEENYTYFVFCWGGGYETHICLYSDHIVYEYGEQDYEFDVYSAHTYSSKEKGFKELSDYLLSL